MHQGVPEGKSQINSFVTLLCCLLGENYSHFNMKHGYSQGQNVCCCTLEANNHVQFERQVRVGCSANLITIQNLYLPVLLHKLVTCLEFHFFFQFLQDNSTVSPPIDLRPLRSTLLLVRY